jgi:hypothetical protein
MHLDESGRNDTIRRIYDPATVQISVMRVHAYDPVPVDDDVYVATQLIGNAVE